jgi:hypothetical protein
VRRKAPVTSICYRRLIDLGPTEAPFIVGALSGGEMTIVGDFAIRQDESGWRETGELEDA